MPLHVQLITPEKTLIDEEADEITLPTTSGEITVLPEHMPLVSQIAPGIVTIKQHGKEEHVAIDGGFLQIKEDQKRNVVIILSDFALSAREASAKDAEEAKKRAELAMKNKASQEELDMLQDEVRRSVLALRLTEKIKH